MFMDNEINLKENVGVFITMNPGYAGRTELPDNLKGSDFFTTISVDDEKTFWHHRELIRYKYGKSKKLTDALEFLESKYKELYDLLEHLEKDV